MLPSPQLKDFITDFPNARDRAAAFDNMVMSGAREVSDEVADLVALTTRTVMGSMDVTCGSDPSDIMFFVSAMGSTHETVNAADARCVWRFYSRCTMRLTSDA